MCGDISIKGGHMCGDISIKGASERSNFYTILLRLCRKSLTLFHTSLYRQYVTISSSERHWLDKQI